jgi:hypothetical protein
MKPDKHKKIASKKYQKNNKEAFPSKEAAAPVEEAIASNSYRFHESSGEEDDEDLETQDLLKLIEEG